jgi:hypothetical protein
LEELRKAVRQLKHRQRQEQKATRDSKQQELEMDDLQTEQETTDEHEEESTPERPRVIHVDLKDRSDMIRLRRSNPVFLSAHWANFNIAVKYVTNDTIKHKKAWCIGFFTVLLVVLFAR